MPIVDYTDPDGKLHSIPMAAGGDPQQVVAQFKAARLDQSITSALPKVGDPDSGPRINNEPLIGTNDPQTIGDEVAQGVGLGLRTVVGAGAKLPPMLADVGSTLFNLIPAGIEKLTGIPQPGRLPTGSTAQLDELLNEVFPEPQGFGQKVIAGAGELFLQGGAGGAALAPKAAAIIGDLIPAVKGGRAVPGLLESIGQSAAKSPKAFATTEASGAGLAEVAVELTDQADAGPVVRTLAPLAAGLAGALAPQTLINTTRRAATGALNLADTVTKGEVRAAKALQAAVDDPKAVAKAAREHPEVLPGRASGEPKLRALEAKVIADDVSLAAKTDADLTASTDDSLKELANSFGPTSGKAEWQQEVILRGMPDNATLNIGHPDEMLAQAKKSFNTAYKASEGFPISTQNVQVVGGNIPFRESIKNAINDPDVFTTPAIQQRVLDRIEPRLTALEKGGKPVPGSTAIEVDSKEILDLRQALRKKQRALDSAGVTSPDAAEEAQLLDNVVKALTDVLESQLPPDAAKALRAVDARYKDFITVRGAVLRSGEKGLTPEALRASVKARESASDFATGKVGDLGKMAEQGKDIASTLAKGRTPGKPDQVARIVRDMTPEQRHVAKADLVEGMTVNASAPNGGVLDGNKMLNQIELNRDVLKAAGFTDADFSRIETISKSLKLYQSLSPAAATDLLNDDVGRFLNLFARIAGSKAGSRTLKFFGGAGVGGSLILTQFGSQQARSMIKGLSIDKAERVMRGAFRGDKVIIKGVEQKQTVFDAMMTRPNDSLKRQAEATRTIKAFLLAPAGNQSENESE